MRHPLCVWIAASLLLVDTACTDGGGTAPPSVPTTPPSIPTAPPPASPLPPVPPTPTLAPTPDTKPAFPCGPELHLGTGEQLLAALTSEWPRPGIGLSPVSVDLVADRDLEVKSDTLPGPAYCTARCTHEPRRVDCKGTGDPCRFPVRFRLNDPVPGVLVDRDSFAHEGTLLRVKAGTRFRLQQRVHEFHPETPYYDPTILVMPACDAPCKAEERRCAATGLCVPAQPEAYCLVCGGHSRQECACRTPDDAAKPDGTHCTFLSGDYFPNGTCTQGRCVPLH